MIDGVKNVQVTPTENPGVFETNQAVSRSPADKLPVQDPPDLTQNPVMRHVMEAIDPSRRSEFRTVADLLRAPEVPFVTSPNPTAWLSAMHAKNEKTVIKNPVERKVMCYNVALLDYKVFGFYSAMKSPYLEERREPLAEAIFSRGDDHVLLQELWRKEDVKLYEKVAEKYGYRAFVGERDKYTDGIATFVKASLIKDGSSVSHEKRAFSAQYAGEYWGIEASSLFLRTGMKRGFQHVTYEDVDLGRVDLFNAHLVSSIENYQKRNDEAREYGRAVRSLAPKTAFVIAGGDLNAPPYAAKDTLDPKEGSNWLENTLMYPSFLHYSKTDDLVVMGQPKENIDADIRSAHQPPTTAGYPWTANAGTNSLYFEQYGNRGGHGGRIDHVTGRGPNGAGLKVMESKVIFTDKVRLPSGRKVELSDHYGLELRFVGERQAGRSR